MEHFPQPPVTPPEILACLWCDGQKQVIVSEVLTSGNIYEKVPHGLRDMYVECECFHCDGTGNEPASDPLDDPRIP